MCSLHFSTPITFQVLVYTSDCHKAGTEHDLQVRVGYIKMDKHVREYEQLLYEFATPWIDGRQGENLERNTFNEVTHIVPNNVVQLNEGLCYYYVFHYLTALDIIERQRIYEECNLKPNIVNLRLFFHNNWGPSWRVGYVNLDLAFTLQTGEYKYNSIRFAAKDDCDYDWANFWYDPANGLFAETDNFQLRVDHKAKNGSGISDKLPNMWWSVGDYYHLVQKHPW
ncbi:hypothetical protein QR680_011671 [Steinernema hermaphroditum]|uniref:Uncharacterized protein n=1 Tax=Steinernema hermaphroditum TaxID=289476 RepID=A0AA39HZD7_9BILA|nr:hypothetical protein QR680_011671 [Steinernema hermaphroditum]